MVTKVEKAIFLVKKHGNNSQQKLHRISVKNGEFGFEFYGC